MEPAIVVCNAFPDDNKGGCAITQQTIEWIKGVYPGSPIYIVRSSRPGIRTCPATGSRLVVTPTSACSARRFGPTARSGPRSAG